MKRIVGAVVVLGIGAALGIALLRIADRGDRQGTLADGSPGPSPTASASPTPGPEEATYVITASSCLRIRERPDLDARVLDCVASGNHLSGDGRVKKADGMRWAHVRTPKLKLNGWASLTFLERIDDEEGEGEPDAEPAPSG